MQNNIVSIAAIAVIFILIIIILISRDEIKKLKSKNGIIESNLSNLSKSISEQKQKFDELKETYEKTLAEANTYKSLHDQREESLHKILEGHKKAFPYLASIMADYSTLDLKILAEQLNWGHNIAREKKVASINSIRASANERIAEAKVATYQLNYLLTLYPSLEDVLDTEEYNELDFTDKGYLTDTDPVRQYLSKEEWASLSEDVKNQRALDNYIKSNSKSKWQIGRDYELYVGYLYEQKGFVVTYYGETHGLEDLGRDLICKKDGKTQIVQCKYWSKDKQIHEKHIFQLFATTVSYCIDNHLSMSSVSPVFVTNIGLSDEAKRVAEQLSVTYIENQSLGNFPRIKCNHGVDENGLPTKIYHLPMDQQYDRVLLIHPGDRMVFTVNEAVAAGFRRAYKWTSVNINRCMSAKCKRQS